MCSAERDWSRSAEHRIHETGLALHSTQYTRLVSLCTAHNTRD